MPTKTHMAVSIGHDGNATTNQSDQPSCHSGCTARYPEDRGCQRWTIPELLRRCEAEVATMQESERYRWIAVLHDHPSAFGLKTVARNMFIMAVEAGLDYELESRIQGVKRRSATLGWSAMDALHEAANQWHLRRQQLALNVLFVYGKLTPGQD